ncbi:MAG: MerR family transcriptional regulator [Acidimicrobiales bacterium]
MSTYTIGEVAERTGFTTSALRYYEGRGLVSPATRTHGGYRVYDDHALTRLAFIARAKRLGCSLEEILDLASVSDGDRCGPVQRRLHRLVTSKITDVHTQIAELTAFTAQLQGAAAQLSEPASDGPCGAECACVAEPARPHVAVSVSAKPTESPIACTLDRDAMPDRLAEWQTLLDQATSRERGPNGALRVGFAADLPLGELARLVTAEQGCCSFFSFTITVDQRGVGLEVGAPEGADDIVAALFGDRR